MWPFRSLKISLAFAAPSNIGDLQQVQQPVQRRPELDRRER